MCDRFFKEGKLINIPKKNKNKLLVLEKISNSFNYDTEYTEKEINAILKTYYEDYAILRRYLVDTNFLCRDNYGTKYKRIK